MALDLIYTPSSSVPESTRLGKNTWPTGREGRSPHELIDLIPFNSSPLIL
jgi:hypothetical protein